MNGTDTSQNLPERTAAAIERLESRAVSGRVLDKHPEDAMIHPQRDFQEEAVPGEYRRIANDPEACRAMAAEVLDYAFDKLGDGKDIRDLATLANCWMRLSELSGKASKP